MIITFAGHSSVFPSEEIKELVKEEIRRCIVGAERVCFYLGGYGDFDKLCACACRELKEERGGLELVYVTPYITPSEQEKIKSLMSEGLYDASIYPPIENTPLRFAISKRNEWMVQNSDLLIAYVNHSYGGAYNTLRAAKRKGKRIINLCDL